MTVSSPSSSRRRYPRSSRRCSSRSCSSTGRAGSSRRRRDDARFRGAAACRSDRRPLRSAICAAGFDQLMLTRVMVLATFALGYNILYGYTGLLSLGHAMFFAAGLYGAGLTAIHFGWEAPAAFLAGVIGGRGAGVPRRDRRTAHQRRGVHDRHDDVRPGLLPAHPLFRRLIRAGTRASPFRMRRATSTLLGSAIDLSNPALRYNLALLLSARSGACGLRTRALAVGAGARRHPGERGPGDDARLRHLSLQALRADALGNAGRRGRRGLRAALRLCRSNLRVDPVFDPTALVDAARRRGNGRRAASSARWR